MEHFFDRTGQKSLSRIVLLAPLPDERKPARVQCTKSAPLMQFQCMPPRSQHMEFSPAGDCGRARHFAGKALTG
jgi:hypothetical protein